MNRKTFEDFLREMHSKIREVSGDISFDSWLKLLDVNYLIKLGDVFALNCKIEGIKETGEIFTKTNKD